MALSVILIVVISAPVARCCGDTFKAPSYTYTAEELSVRVIQCHPGSVREEPAAINGAICPDNVLGSIREDGFTIYLDSGKVYRVENQANESDGFFYGLLVTDIVSTTEGKQWFPSEKKMENDADGIIWVDEECIKILL